MQAPDFWRRDGVLPRLLTPAAWMYDLGARIRYARVTPQRAEAPVICVGNLVAGGAGKTPVALALGAMLRQAGRRPCFLTRGYGGRLPGPVRVEPGRHDATEVGDEALLLAVEAPTWVAADRRAGAAAAVAGGADVIVMDDGFQNPSLAKDLSLLVVDGGYGFGNGRVLPAGPLRERSERGLARADAVVVVASPMSRERPALPGLRAGVPVLPAQLVPDAAASRFAGRRVLAFAGIGRPSKFFETMAAVGAELVGGRGFPDHYAYRPDEIMQLVENAHAADAILVTTEKDYARLPPEARPMVQVLRVTLQFDAPDAMAAILRRMLGDG